MSLMPLLAVKCLQAPRYGTTQHLCSETSYFGKKILAGTSAKGKCKELIHLCSVALLVLVTPSATLKIAH